MRHPESRTDPRPAARSLLLLVAGALAVAPALSRAEEAAGDAPAAAPADAPAPPAAEPVPASAAEHAPLSASEPAPSPRAETPLAFSLDPRRLVPHYEYLEDSYLDYFLPNVGPVQNTSSTGQPIREKPLFFEAQAATHLFLWNQWARAQDRRFHNRWLLVNSFGVSFILRLRMVQEYSAPVRPPSYVPRIDYQFYALRRTRPDLVDQFEVRVTPWGHHSNGQQNCTFATNVTENNPAPTGSQCIIPDTKTRNYLHAVNFRTGDFSTSYFIVGGHYARIGLDRDEWTKWRWGLGGLFEGNPRPWGPGTIDEIDAMLYGQWRAQLDLEARYHLDSLLGIEWLRGMASLTGMGQLIWHVAPGISNHRVVVEFAYQPDDFRGAGGFLRYYDGQDDLNVLYAAGRTQKIVFGIIWSGSPQVQYRFGKQ